MNRHGKTYHPPRESGGAIVTPTTMPYTVRAGCVSYGRHAAFVPAGVGAGLGERVARRSQGVSYRAGRI